MQRHFSLVCHDTLHVIGRTTLSLFSLSRGMSRGKVIRLHRRKQDNISGEQSIEWACIFTWNYFVFQILSSGTPSVNSYGP